MDSCDQTVDEPVPHEKRYFVTLPTEEELVNAEKKMSVCSGNLSLSSASDDDANSDDGTSSERSNAGVDAMMEVFRKMEQEPNATTTSVTDSRLATPRSRGPGGNEKVELGGFSSLSMFVARVTTDQEVKLVRNVRGGFRHPELDVDMLSPMERLAIRRSELAKVGSSPPANLSESAVSMRGILVYDPTRDSELVPPTAVQPGAMSNSLRRMLLLGVQCCDKFVALSAYNQAIDMIERCFMQLPSGRCPVIRSLLVALEVRLRDRCVLHVDPQRFFRQLRKRDFEGYKEHFLSIAEVGTPPARSGTIVLDRMAHSRSRSQKGLPRLQSEIRSHVDGRRPSSPLVPLEPTDWSAERQETDHDAAESAGHSSAEDRPLPLSAVPATTTGSGRVSSTSEGTPASAGDLSLEIPTTPAAVSPSTTPTAKIVALEKSILSQQGSSASLNVLSAETSSSHSTSRSDPSLADSSRYMYMCSEEFHRYVKDRLEDEIRYCSMCIKVAVSRCLAAATASGT